MGEVEVKILDIEHVDDRTRALDIINNMWVYRNVEIRRESTKCPASAVTITPPMTFCPHHLPSCVFHPHLCLSTPHRPFMRSS
ncbi:hypothetical protein Y032_0278g1161 [Ancylostoma ceylanicum]|nr:hypothetical protein Y032_0278g1161 [Ancylostoma ceylanicum]